MSVFSIRQPVLLCFLVSVFAFAQDTDQSGQKPINAVTTTNQTSSNTIARPILFVHGYCSDDTHWAPMINYLATYLLNNNPTQYRSTLVYGAYYDGSQVNFFDFYTGQPVNKTSISKDVRFFTIIFHDQRQSDFNMSFDPVNVSNIAIPVKGTELAKVVAAIQDVTYTKDLTIIAHSMGGLVSRSYLEGLAGPITQINPDLTYIYSPSSTPYRNNIGNLITVDSPHGGQAVTVTETLASIFTTCSINSFNRKEMNPNDAISVIQPLNYFPNTFIGTAKAQSISQAIEIRSIKSYNTVAFGFADPNTDGVVNSNSQDIRLSLQNQILLNPQFVSIDNNFGNFESSLSTCYASGQYILHFIDCVGAQSQTLSLISSAITSNNQTVPLGVSSVVLSTNPITGGQNGQAIINLNDVAPPNGATVTLAITGLSNQSVTIAPNTNSVNFNFSTSTVAIPQNITFTATYGWNSASTILTINPLAPIAFLSSSSLSFNSSLVGFSSNTQQLILTNTGTATLNISSVSVSGDFTQTNNCPGVLPVNTSCLVNIVFKPSTFGNRSGTLTINDNALGSPHIVSLSGQGVDIAIVLNRIVRPHIQNNFTSTPSPTFYNVRVSGLSKGTNIEVVGCAVKAITWKCSPSISDNNLLNQYEFIAEQSNIQLVLTPTRSNSARLRSGQQSVVSTIGMKVKIHIRINGIDMLANATLQ